MLLLLFCVAGWGRKNNTFTVLQWNIWQEGTQVKGGYEAIIDELERLRPDFVTFSEVRNYRGTNFIARVVASMKARGLDYYGFYSDDTGLLSRYPITDSVAVFPVKNDHGSVHKLVSSVHGREVAVYTAHLDYLDDAYYNVRGYDGSTWREIPLPKTVEEVLERNAKSQRDEGIAAFIAEARKDLAAGRCVILGGDFNEPSHLDWTEATRYLYDHRGMVIPWPQTVALEKAGYTDCFRAIYPNPVTHPGITFPTDNPLVPVERLTWAPNADERDRIDYLFCQGRGLQVTDCRLFGPEGSIAYGRRVPNSVSDRFIKPLGVWPTDHKALLATFRLK